jgi:bacteriorhodopsin
MNQKLLLDITEKSFYAVFFIMAFAFVLSVVSSFLTKDNLLRKILIIETMITGISCFMYFMFLKNITSYFNLHDKSEDNEIDLTVIDRLRYKGWVFTTPLMLIALCFVFQNSIKINIDQFTLFSILVLNYIMLLFGFLGEIKVIEKFQAMILGFIPFFIIFYLLFTTFIIHTINPFNYLIFSIYFVIWAGYGISYIQEEKIKNILMNIFDCFSKALVAVILAFTYMIWQ